MGGQSPHFHGHRQRLRDRFVKSGLAGFADYEVVELLLTLAIPRADVKQPARALLARFGSLRGILNAPLAQFLDIAPDVLRFASLGTTDFEARVSRTLAEAIQGLTLL